MLFIGSHLFQDFCIAFCVVTSKVDKLVRCKLGNLLWSLLFLVALNLAKLVSECVDWYVRGHSCQPCDSQSRVLPIKLPFPDTGLRCGAILTVYEEGIVGCQTGASFLHITLSQRSAWGQGINTWLYFKANILTLFVLFGLSEFQVVMSKGAHPHASPIYQG